MARYQINHTSNPSDDRVERARNFLCGYQFCMDMLNLRHYERRRANVFQDVCDCDELIAQGEAYWRARMCEIGALISSMKNSREKLILFYHYIRGESIEHAANIIGVSRRTGYRLHQKGLTVAAALLEKKERH